MNGQSVISTIDMAAQLVAPGTKILDATYKMPGVSPDAVETYESGHIPGALFFDINAIADRSNPLPHMLPSAKIFAAAMDELGIGNDDLVIVYDATGLMSAGRVWWTMRAFGHRKIALLNGGLKRWIAEGRPTETGKMVPRRAAGYVAAMIPNQSRTKVDLIENIKSGQETVIDARSKGRFRRQRTGKLARPSKGTYSSQSELAI